MPKEKLSMRHVQSFFAWGFLVEARLAAEGRFHLADQLQPLLAGPGGQVSQRGNDALARPGGGVVGFDQLIICISLAVLLFGFRA